MVVAPARVYKEGRGLLQMEATKVIEQGSILLVIVSKICKYSFNYLSDKKINLQVLLTVAYKILLILNQLGTIIQVPEYSI